MTMKEAILGISAYYHDSAAAQEERFPRTKHNSRFPIHACQYVLEEAGLDYNDLQAVAFYDKPLVKFERSLETYHAVAPSGVWSFATAIPVWIKESSS